MKVLVSAVAAIFLLSYPVSAEEADLPFNLKHYGSFVKTQHSNMKGVVDLTKALKGEHLYAVGALADGRGEITVYDSGVWLSYGKEGLDKTTKRIPKGEQAVLLVTAQVQKWREIPITQDMSELELQAFIIKQADKHGLDTRFPFPFIIEGPVSKLVWHVINGSEAGTGGHHGQDHGAVSKLTEKREHASVVLIGFYSARIRDAFTHPGESFHVHVLFRDEGKAGHVDEFSVSKSSILKIPGR